MKTQVAWPRLVIGAGLVFLYVPVLTVALLSISDRSVPIFPMGQLTADWYVQLIRDERFVQTGLRSLIVAFSSSTLGLILGTGGALGVTKLSGRKSAALVAVFVAPNMIPALVLGVALALTFGLYRVPLSMVTIVVGHSLLTSAITFLIVSSRLRGFEWSTIESARVLGATALQAFRRVTLPLLGPALVGSFLLGIAVSFDDFILAFFLTGGDSTLPLLMWSMMRRGFSPTANALATILVVSTFGLAVIAERLVGRRSRSGL